MKGPNVITVRTDVCRWTVWIKIFGNLAELIQLPIGVDSTYSEGKLYFVKHS